MGGGGSRIRDQGKRLAVPASHRKIYLFAGHPGESHPEDILGLDFLCLTTDCTQIPRPIQAHPICCFSDLSLPFFNLPLSKSDGTPTNLRLPIFALGRYEFGRVVVLGSYDFLTELSVDREADMIFVENFLRWAGGPSPVTRASLLYNFPDELSTTLIPIMHGLGFGFETLQSGPIDFTRYISIFVWSDCDQISEIREFLSVGGAIICGAAPEGTPNRFAMNEVLADAGLGFLPRPYISSQSSERFLTVPSELPDQRTAVFSKQISRFITFLKDPALDIDSIVDWIVILMGYTELLNPGHGQDLLVLCDSLVLFLRRANFQTQDGQLGLTSGHTLFIRMICLLFRKMPADDLCRFDLSVPFLGHAAQFVDVESTTMRITCGGWWSTGFWLPAGIPCRVNLSREAPRVKLQIGAHTRDLSENPGPWERWPSLVITVDVVPGECQIASPYGGLVYIVSDSQVGALNSKSFVIEFSEVCLAPFYSFKNDEKWAASSESECPWCEIQTKHVTFTVQTDFILSLPSVSEPVALMTDLFDSINQFLAVPDGFIPARVVVDIGLPPPGMQFGYPLFIDFSWCDTIFRSTAPTPSLLQFLASTAVHLLPDSLFCPFFRGILALLAASYAISKRWPSSSPMLLPQLDGRVLWSGLSSLTGKLGWEAFSTTLCRVRSRSLASGFSFSESAEMFVATLSQRAKRPFPALLEQIVASEQSSMSTMDVIHGKN
jgi:hypothetical protein